MHSSAQVNFQVGSGSELVALLDTQSCFGSLAQPLSLNVLGNPFQFLVWPSGYLEVNLEPNSDIHISEFSEDDLENNQGDLGHLLDDLWNGVDASTTNIDTVYTTTATSSRFIHKPSSRYLVAWVGVGKTAVGKLRALESGGGPSQVVPPPPVEISW